ncbi:S-methyl-5'-thioadenosine phosphorylase [Methanocella sp. CWC-04]|uniref:Probable 6-oxopurine nucleoside phosphorylase n=1 Tax=Methanooceanicella nereidis TaxID=2052831 RepID=A0AAP2RD27_9EURY|nr:S-methyl-5'-thioadenosine phosphorylase [Methanocella sp. CWC-04]MCD1293785.1 S-methyl-5'-thioadenosine phosphorylase [Methanocella sp. CWC-04]
MPRLAIIGGSGFYRMTCAAIKGKKTISTKYGDVTVSIYENEKGEDFVFLPRHGECHICAPHRIDYRANIMALKELGVERIIGVVSVGSLKEHIKPGSFVLLDQFIDFTKARPSTFYDEEGFVVHTDVTEPYCPEIRDSILSSMPGDIPLHEKGTYVCAEGPRFETAAEIKMFAMLGGDVVGMTNVPECVLARELGMCYAAIAVVTNYAAGISKTPISHEEVLDEMRKVECVLHEYVVDRLFSIPVHSKCSCSMAASRMC